MRLPHSALLLLLVISSIPAFCWADERGRILVRIEGAALTPIPPSLMIDGPQTAESVMLGAVAVAKRELRFEGLEPGFYRASMTGGSAGTEGVRIEVAVQPARTAVVVVDLAGGTMRIDPDRPDPFGLDDEWSPRTTGTVPGSGEAAALAMETSPLVPRAAYIDGCDLSGRGFRSEVIVRGRSIARAGSIPIGPAPASEESSRRSVLSDTDDRFIDAEAATGSQGGGSGDGAAAYSFDHAPWKPRLFASIRPLRQSDAAPSVFGGGKLPHNDLDALDLLARLDLRPDSQSRLALLLYGAGSRRNYFLEAFRKDAGHSPREDRASINGAARAEHRFGARTLVLAEADWQRTYVATGDGRFFDRLSSYRQPVDVYMETEEDLGLYWIDSHVYDSFRKQVQMDIAGRIEGWIDSGTGRAAGAGVSVRRSVYRSYEHLNPIQTILGNDAGYTRVNSIGYETTGKTHDDTAGHEPGKPLYFGAFATARRPAAGGDVEIGARLTGYRTGQRPIRDFSRPVSSVGTEEALNTAPEVTRSNIDPRLAYTRPIGARGRLWLAAGATTRVPPSEALYYSSDFVMHANTPDSPESTVIGNPALKPEREWSAVTALGYRISPSLWLRAGLAGMRTSDAITPRAFQTEAPSMIFVYVNDGRREVVDLFARAEWEPSSALRLLGSYDLSKARTETVEPLLLDQGWSDPTLPLRGAAAHEGLPQIFPAFDDGVDRGFFPSSSDRRHRLSGTAIIHPAPGSLGESMTSLLQSTEFSISAHAASGSPFTWIVPYPAGSLPQSEPRILPGAGINGGRGPWIGQLDLRAARDFPMGHGAFQLWLEVRNVTGRRNALYVYPATGLATADASTRTGEPGYQTRLKDPIRYGEARTYFVGLRFHARHGEGA